MPATTAAARAGSSTVGPATAAIGTPSLGARSTTARAATPPAIDHSSSDSWLTGMPSSRARSMFSAMPRTAMPASEPSRNQVSPIRTIGTTASRSRSSPVIVAACTDHRWSPSIVSTLGIAGLEFSHEGRKMAMPASSWARPIVATVNTRRGASTNRRMISRSTSAPIATPTATPIAAATPQFQPLSTASVAASAPGTLPMAP